MQATLVSTPEEALVQQQQMEPGLYLSQDGTLLVQVVRHGYCVKYPMDGADLEPWGGSLSGCSGYYRRLPADTKLIITA